MTPAKPRAAKAASAPAEPVSPVRAAKATRARPAASKSARQAAAQPATPRPVAATAAKPAAKPAVRPVVKAVAAPVVPAVKGGAQSARVTPTPKVTPPAKRAPAGSAAGVAPESKRTTSRARRAPTAPAAPAVPPPADPDPPAVESPYARPGNATAPADAPDGTVTRRDRAGDTAPVRGFGGRPGRRHTRGTGDVIGDADERHPDEPVVPLDPLGPGIFDELFEPDRHTGRWPLPARVARGDWRPSLFAALPALLLTLVVAAIGVWGMLQTETPGREERFFGTPSTGRWFRYVAAAIGATFGGPVTFTTEADTGDGTEDFGSYALRAVPLTVTLVALLAVWFFTRRAQDRNVVPDRVADSVRVAAVFAVGVAALSLLGRWQSEGSSELAEEFAFRTSGEMAVWRPLFWAFCGAFVAAWLAAGQFTPGERLRTWLVAVRGALVGLAAGTAASLLLLVALGYGYADRAGADASHVTRGVPLALGYGVNFGISVFGVLCGGRLEIPFAMEYPQWSLWSPWVPNSFALLLVVPALSVVAAACYVVRRGGLDTAGTVRACDRMGAPAAVAWLLLAIAAGLHYDLPSSQFGGRGGGGLSTGPVLWTALLVALWFGAGGWVAGRVLTRRAARAGDRPPDAADEADVAPEAAPAP